MARQGGATGRGDISWGRIARRIRVPLGFIFAALFLWLARPSWLSLAWSLWVVVPGIWLRGYASGYVKKNAELAVSGPYAYTRNPLYLGSMLIAFGFAGAARSVWIFLALAVLFAAIYAPTIRSEEEFLRGAFPEFEEYMRRVPRLFPRLTPAELGRDTSGQSGGGGFSRDLYLKHREYNALLGAVGIYAALALRLYFAHSHEGN
jgi:protein-S-isoprenylcysteine O-methyltransferase Ste14